MAELVYALVLETSAARLKSSSLLPTKYYESRSKIKKGLRTVLSIIVDKKYTDKMDERLKELQKVALKVSDLARFLSNKKPVWQSIMEK